MSSGQMAAAGAFSLDLSLSSGQSFGWKRAGDGWEGMIREAGFFLREKRGKGVCLEFSSSIGEMEARGVLNHYLALEEDPVGLLAGIPMDPFLSKAWDHCLGMRILRQDPWECLAGFILSSTKQICQIEQIWGRICKQWGSPVTMKIKGDSRVLHSFPVARVIASVPEGELRACGMGFRAPYLLHTAGQIANGVILLEELKKMEYMAAREQLMKLKGVGPKIADCVLLFSLDKSNVFPVDTWIHKVLKNKYFKKKGQTNQNMQLVMQQRFKMAAGYVQQCFFHYSRSNPKIFITNNLRMRKKEN